MHLICSNWNKTSAAYQAIKCVLMSTSCAWHKALFKFKPDYMKCQTFPWADCLGLCVNTEDASTVENVGLTKPARTWITISAFKKSQNHINTSDKILHHVKTTIIVMKDFRLKHNGSERQMYAAAKVHWHKIILMGDLYGGRQWPKMCTKISLPWLGGIAFLLFARWQQQFAIACFDLQISPSTGGSRTPIYHNVLLDPTSVPAKWHPNPSNSLSRVHERDRRQTDRRRYREMYDYRRNRLH